MVARKKNPVRSYGKPESAISIEWVASVLRTYKRDSGGELLDLPDPSEAPSPAAYNQFLACLEDPGEARAFRASYRKMADKQMERNAIDDEDEEDKAVQFRLLENLLRENKSLMERKHEFDSHDKARIENTRKVAEAAKARPQQRGAGPRLTPPAKPAPVDAGPVESGGAGEGPGFDAIDTVEPADPTFAACEEYDPLRSYRRAASA
jgi:hypothetical protein